MLLRMCFTSLNVQINCFWHSLTNCFEFWQPNATKFLLPSVRCQISKLSRSLQHRLAGTWLFKRPRCIGHYRTPQDRFQAATNPLNRVNKFKNKLNTKSKQVLLIYMWPLYAAEPHHAIQIKRRHEPRLGIQRQASLRCIIRVLGRCFSPWVASMTSIKLSTKRCSPSGMGNPRFPRTCCNLSGRFLILFSGASNQIACMYRVSVQLKIQSIIYIIFMACNEEAILLVLFRHNLFCQLQLDSR